MFFFFLSGVSAIQKLCAVNTSITVKNAAVSKKHIKGRLDQKEEQCKYFHENTRVSACVCVCMRQEEKVLSLRNVLTLLPLKCQLVMFLLLQFSEPPFLSNENLSRVFWGAFDHYLFFSF